MKDRKDIKKVLTFAGILTGVWLVVLFLLTVPLLALSCAEMYPELAQLMWPGIAVFWLIGLMCALGLREFVMVTRRIAQDRSFCPENAAAFRRISYMAWGCVALLLAGMIGLSLAAHLHPSILLFLLIAGLPAVIAAILTRALAWLVDGASRLQQDCDLTI